MPSVHLVYGFSEGKWHGKKFSRELKRRGYDIAPTITDADYVLAHSGGCYNIPPLRDDQILVLINPPYWPGRSIPQRAINTCVQLLKALRPGRGSLYQAHKGVRLLGYLIYHRRRNKFMAERSKTFNLEEEIKHSKTILIRNHHDPWLTPDLDKLQKINPHLRIERLPGIHDDCWLHPEPYIDLLEGKA